MKYILTITMLLLTSCAYTHRTELASPPEDPAKYEIDLKECRAAASNRWDVADRENRASDPTLGLFGAAGAAAATLVSSSQNADKNSDYYKTMPQMTDECMSDRGYDVAEDK